ncbi:MAG TPA: type II toxin-antitoxin system VapC family toxin [Candidatus Omnitrophica bacterium]|nr:type II toxin-antitoxin system VapC family toxin [Candidatus Omnitrophota bacterium]
MRYLIDTNIIIDHLRGDKTATSFLEEIENRQIKASISVITEYELLACPILTKRQEKEIISFVKIFAMLNITPSIVKTAACFKKTYSAGIVDSLIAATAYRSKSTLITRNIKHFKNIKEIQIKSI